MTQLLRERSTRRSKNLSLPPPPPLSRMSSAPGWPTLLLPSGHVENCRAAAGGEDGGGNAREEGRVVVRARTAPAGPHPYLDRLASDMHRPFEGDDSSWRQTSIQPVPIPDLGHTGIRTKFSQAAGGGFTLDGAMTETFRSGIHDAIRNLPRMPPPDARDVRTRDYARDTRRHRADPWNSGSLIHAHMTSLEFGGGPFSSPPLSPHGCSWPREGLIPPGSPLRQSRCLGPFRGSLSPPASLSDRRALVRHGSRGRVGSVVGGAAGESPRSPLETRKALLLREMSRVKSAAAVVAGYRDQAGGIGLDTTGSVDNGCDFEPSSRWREAHPSSAWPSLRVERAHWGEDGAATLLAKKPERTAAAVIDCRKSRQGNIIAGEERPEVSLLPRREGRRHKRRHKLKRGRDAEDQRSLLEADGSPGGGGRLLLLPAFSGTSPDVRETQGVREDFEDLAGGNFGNRAGYRERARRRESRRRYMGFSPIEEPKNGSSSRHGDAVRSNATAATKTQAPPPPSATPAETLSFKKTPPRKPQQRRARGGLPKRRRQQQQQQQQRLRKPFSADNLFDCLLDVRFGNTTDLSPSGGARWDLKALSSGLVATAATAEEQACSNGRATRGCAETDRRCVLGPSAAPCGNFDKYSRSWKE